MSDTDEPLIGAPPPQLPERSAAAIIKASQARGFRGPQAAHDAVGTAPTPASKPKAAKRKAAKAKPAPAAPKAPPIPPAPETPAVVETQE